MKFDYELYIGMTNQNRSKKFFVSNEYVDAREAAKKHLRVSEKHILIQHGWVIGENLYLRNPNLKGQKKVWVAYYIA